MPAVSTVTVRSTAPAGASQAVRAQLRLRELIVGGSLSPGERIAELAMVERLGMSRTPIRTALVRLQEEGLLEPLPGGGFVVREFSETDIRDAIEVRGTLEGLAARLAAERGPAPEDLAAMRECIDRIDTLLAKAELSPPSVTHYVTLNARFHALLAQMSGSPIVQRQIARAVTLPFASPNSVMVSNLSVAKGRDRLVIANAQHRAVMDAVGRGEGARAQALMQEHARLAHANLAEALSPRPSQRLPGAGLIRRSAAR